MSVTELPLSEECRDRLFHRAEDMLARALDMFAIEFEQVKAKMDADLAAHYSDLYAEARAFVDACPVNSWQGQRARRLIMHLTSCIAASAAVEETS